MIYLLKYVPLKLAVPEINVTQSFVGIDQEEALHILKQGFICALAYHKCTCNVLSRILGIDIPSDLGYITEVQSNFSPSPWDTFVIAGIEGIPLVSNDTILTDEQLKGVSVKWSKAFIEEKNI